jgi:5-guanidino-2-oxopentanoate decarboxylase
MRNERTCGEAIVALLESYGVEIVFGIPGVHTLELYRGLVNSRIRHVSPRHEQGAGFMADGYARTTGRPGVCFLITGPGLTNAVTAIAQAYSDSVPMLVISSVNPADTLGRGLGELHELKDQQGLMTSCTAFSVSIKTPQEFPAVLARAFDLFRSARPRPVHIEVPIDIFERRVDGDWQAAPLSNHPTPKPGDVQKAVALLSSAQRPMIIAGGGAASACEPLKVLAEKLAAPVATSVGGLGVFPSSHPLSLGSTLVGAETRRLFENADVVLAVGTELSTTDTWGPRYAFSGKLIRVDVDAAQFGNGQLADLGIAADASSALAAIASEIPHSASSDRRKAAEERVRAALAAFEENLGEGDRQRKAVFEAVVAAAPADAIFTADMTQIAYTAHTVFRPDEPGRFFYPQGYGTLGYALPSALGVKLGSPGRAVIALVGDGGFLYTIQ